MLQDASFRAALNLGLMVLGLATGDSPQLLAALSTASFSHRVGFPPEAVGLSLDSLLYRPLRFDYFNQDQLTKRITWDVPLPLLTAGALAVVLAYSKRLQASPLAPTYLRDLRDLHSPLAAVAVCHGPECDRRSTPCHQGYLHGPVLRHARILPDRRSTGASHWVGTRRVRPEHAGADNGGVRVRWLLSSLFMLMQPKFFLFYRNGVDGWGEKNYQVGSIDRLLKKETGSVSSRQRAASATRICVRSRLGDG